MSLNFKDGMAIMPIPPEGAPMDFSGTAEMGIYATSTTQRHAISRRTLTWDGRVFRYCKAGGACVAYHGAGSEAKHAYAGEALVSSVVVGDMSVLVTQAGFAKDELRGGYITVYGAGDHAMNRLIIGNDISGTTTTRIYIDGPISVAGDTLYHEVFQNPYKYITTVALNYACRVCVPAVNIADLSYGWGQTWGPCVVSPGEDVGTRAVEQDNMVFGPNGGVWKTDSAADTYKQKAGFILNSGSTTYGPLIMLQISI